MVEFYELTFAIVTTFGIRFFALWLMSTTAAAPEAPASAASTTPPGATEPTPAATEAPVAPADKATTILKAAGYSDDYIAKLKTSDRLGAAQDVIMKGINDPALAKKIQDALAAPPAAPAQPAAGVKESPKAAPGAAPETTVEQP